MRFLSFDELSAVAGGQGPTLGNYASSFNTPYGSIQVYASGYMAGTNATEYISDGSGGVIAATLYGTVNNVPNAELGFFNALYDLQTNYSQVLDSSEQQAAAHGVHTIELYNANMPPIQKMAGVAYVPVHSAPGNNYFVYDGDILSALQNS